MTHEELLAKVNEAYEANKGYLKDFPNGTWGDTGIALSALRAVVELHKPAWGHACEGCGYTDEGSPNHFYPCPTIEAIEKELA